MVSDPVCNCYDVKVWHHNAIGFDERLGEAMYDKSDETPATVKSVILQLPIVVQRGKRSSSSQAGGENAEQYNGRITIELTNKHQLDAL